MPVTLRKAVLMLMLVVMATPAFAGHKPKPVVVNKTYVENNTYVTDSNEDSYGRFDYGLYLDFVKEDILKTKLFNVDVGVKTDWLCESNVGTVRTGATIKF